MAFTLAVGQLVELRVYASEAEQTAINAVHFQVTQTTGGPTTDADAASGWAAIVPGLYKNVMSNDATYRGLGVRVLTGAGLLPAEAFSAIGAGVGALMSPVQPRQVCGLISAYTGFKGRSQRGRCYVPFPSNSLNDVGGVPVAGYAALLSAIKAILYGPIIIVNGGATGTAVMSPVIFHRATSTGTPVASAVTRPRWATQRRRGSYGRPNVSPV